MDSLETLVKTAFSVGWATGNGSFESFRGEAARLAWEEVPTRRGGPTVATLRPKTQAQALPKSLSKQYGLGPQPLHTDGAHFADPPEIVILFSKEPNSTPTLLYRPDQGSSVRSLSNSAAEHGMFVVQSGRDSFFAPARSGGAYRYDPGCMSPCDVRARDVAFFFSQAIDHATEHSWSGKDQILVIDNRKALHARAALAEADDSRELKRVAFRLGSST